MDLFKFEDMVRTSELYFPTITKLRETDPFEGVFPRRWLTPDVVQGADEDDHRSRVETFGRIHDIVGNYLVNCWHESNYESVAMWNVYLKSGEGIAVRSTFGKLEGLMYYARPSAFFRRVRYVDYTKPIPFDPYGVDNWITHKRLGYEYEKEVRALIGQTDIPDLMPAKPYARVRLPLDQMIDHVAIAPGASDALLSKVEGLVKGSTFSKATVHRSSLDELP